MHRIDTTHVVADLFGSGKDGFGDGDPGLTAATELDAKFANAIQEEIAAVVEDAGLTLDDTNRGQLLAAGKPLTARYGVTGSAVNSGQHFTLTAQDVDTGFVLSSNTVAVPHKGIYLVSFSMLVKAADTSNPLMLLTALVSDVTRYFGTTRFSATAADFVGISGSFIAELTPSDVIALNAATTGTNMTHEAINTPNGFLSVTCLRRTA